MGKRLNAAIGASVSHAGGRRTAALADRHRAATGLSPLSQLVSAADRGTAAVKNEYVIELINRTYQSGRARDVSAQSAAVPSNPGHAGVETIVHFPEFVRRPWLDIDNAW
jgi:hypothetical protein